MSVPISQMYTVASYVIKQKLSGRKRYPLVLMLEPLFRCNLACAGCGKKSGNEKCHDCMVHCGYEATAVNFTFSSVKGFAETVAVTLTGKL